MQIQVSLTIELNATASLTQMEEDVQHAGHRWMRQGLQEAVRQWEEEHPPAGDVAARRCELKARWVERS